MDGVDENTSNGAIPRTGNSPSDYPSHLFSLLTQLRTSHYQTIRLAGLTDGGIPQDGGLFADRRSGRRSRRHKGPTKLIDGYSPPMALDKQDNDAGQNRFVQKFPGDGGMCI